MPNYQNTFHNSKSKKRRYRRLKKKRHENRNKHNNNNDIEQEETKQNDLTINTTNQQQPSQSNNNIEENKNNNDENITYIDGSIMEGGGQIVRNSICLSGLLHKPIIIHKIRANRNTPGLRPQHKFGISMIQRIFGGQLNGNYIKSTKLEFYPKLIRNKKKIDMTCDMKTAGSISLLIQTILPCLLFSETKSKIKIKGGTNVFFSPSIDYIKLVLIPMLNKLCGIKIGIDIKRRGFFPRGNGEIELYTKPINGMLPCFNMTNKGILVKIYGIIVLSGDKMNKNIGYEMIDGAIKEFENRLNIRDNKVKIDIKVREHKSDSMGCTMTIVCETDNGCLFGSDGLADYTKNRGIENTNYFQLGKKTAQLLIDDFIKFEDGCTDKWLQDQLIIFMALGNGVSQFKSCKLELHTQTAMHFVEQMTGVKFIVKEEENSVLIQCDGIGLKNEIKN